MMEWLSEAPWPMVASTGAGWLALLLTVGQMLSGLRARLTRRKIGPPELRERLVEARLYAAQIAVSPATSSWFFGHPERFGVPLKDIAERMEASGDSQLRTHLLDAAAHLNETAAHAVDRESMSTWEPPHTHKDEDDRIERAAEAQKQKAREGLDCISAALKRLNVLERPLH